MKLTEVSNTDGRMCAQLLNLLKLGRWDLSGQDINAHGETVRWVHALATQMAHILKPAEPATPAGGFKVKSAGPLGPAKPSNKRNRKK